MKRLGVVLLLVAAAFGQGNMTGTGKLVGHGLLGIQPLPPQFSLTVSVTGTGTVIASPNGLGNTPISCPPSCAANYSTGTSVTLSESPGSGQSFAGWGGAASGCGTSATCILVITGNTLATATFTGTSGGGPTSYTARTDGCYFPTSYAGSCSGDPTCASVCNPALTVGQQQGGLGALLRFTEGTTDPVPFSSLSSGLANQNNCFTDPDFGTYECWLTDSTAAHMNGASDKASWVLGSDGAYDAWNNDSTMIIPTNTGSVQQLFHIIPSRIHGQTCTPLNPCIVASNIKSGALNGIPAHDNILFDQNAGLVFSRNVADGNNTIFERGDTYVNQLTISSGLSGGIPTGVDVLTRTLVVDFTSDSPVPCSVLPQGYVANWTGQASLSLSDTFTVALGGGAPWPAKIGVTPGTGTQAVTTDIFAQPTNNLALTGTVTSISGVAGTVTMVTDVAFFAYVTESVTIAGTVNYNGTFALLTANNSTHTYTFAGTTAATEHTGTAKVSIKKTAFQVTTNGTTGASEPNWIANCPLLGQTCTDGSAVWTNIGGVGGQGPGFDVVNYRPGVGCKRMNTRLAKTYNGTGVGEPAGLLLTDDTTICNRMSNNVDGSIGCNGSTVTFTDQYTLHAGSQAYDSRYGVLTPTGGGSVNTDFNNGSCTPPVNAGSPNSVFPNWPSSVWISGQAYAKGQYASDPTNHNYYKTNLAVTSATQPHLDAVNWKYESSYCYDYQWEVATNIIRACLELGPSFGCDAHRAEGTQYFYQGGRYYAHNYGTPQCQNSTGNCTYVGAPNGGSGGGPFAALPISGCADGHPTYRNVGNLDLQPFFIPRGDVPSWPTKFTCSTYDMVESIANLVSNPAGQQTVWRHGTAFNSGSSALFSAQNAIGVVSQDGTLLAVGTDGMNSRGDRSVSNTVCQHPYRGQYSPAVGTTTLTVNDFIMPVTANNNQVIYQVTSCVGGGLSCAFTKTPTWNSCQAGPCTLTTVDAVYTFVGPNTCRSDVLIMDVSSSHIAP